MMIMEEIVMSEETNNKETTENRVKSFDELLKEVQASWSDDAWMVYEAASKSFVEETTKESKNNE